MSVVTDYPDYSPHVAHAQQIAATGVPLLTLATPVLNTSNHAIAGAAVYAPGILPVTQIGYEVWIQATTTAPATVPFLQVKLSWIDSASGRDVTTDAWYVPCASSAGGFISIGHGPSKANSVAITVLNLDPSVTATINFVILQNSRVYPRDAWQWDMNTASGSAIPGFTLPTLPNDQSVMGVLNAVTVPAASNKGFLFGMPPGQLVSLNVSATGITPGSVGLIVSALPSSVYTNGAQLIDTTLTSPSFSVQFPPPRAPLFMELLNNATSGTLTVSGMMTAQAA